MNTKLYLAALTNHTERRNDLIEDIEKCIRYINRLTDKVEMELVYNEIFRLKKQLDQIDSDWKHWLETMNLFTDGEPVTIEPDPKA
jgi:hypothetical protein